MKVEASLVFMATQAKGRRVKEEEEEQTRSGDDAGGESECGNRQGGVGHVVGEEVGVGAEQETAPVPLSRSLGVRRLTQRRQSLDRLVHLEQGCR